MKKISETYDMKVFTDNGEYFGDIEESILTQNKVFGWRVRATKNSFLNKLNRVLPQIKPMLSEKH